jgi:CxxC-x17-CxxC domain-containing protein
MNKFKKPRSNSIGGSRISSRPSSRPGGRPSFGAPTRPRFGGGSSAGRGRDDVPQKFDAVCSKCGKACQVPFRPNGKRPVYCNDCFGAPQQSLSGKSSFGTSASGNSGGAGESGGKSIADLTRQIAAMNAKIDTMLEILQGDES